MNIVLDLADAFSSSKEDFFTAVLASMMRRHEPLKLAFLGWIDDATGSELAGLSWEVQAQRTYPAAAEYRDAVIDMVLRSGRRELWCEHKVDSKLGKYGGGDQIDKYLDAAARRMLGRSRSDPLDLPAEWPEGSSGDCVQLVLITRDWADNEMSKHREPWKMAKGALPGLLWADGAGHLRWRQFYPLARGALAPVLDGHRGEFEATLARQFLAYWRSMKGMWAESAHSSWSELLPQREGKTGPFPDAPFGSLWEDEFAVARELGWTRNRVPYKGNDHTFDPHLPGLLTVQTKAFHSAADLEGDSRELGAEIIEVSFWGTSIPPAEPDDAVPFERWRAWTFERWMARTRVTAVSGKPGEHCFRVQIGVVGWADCSTEAGRRRVIRDAFVAAVRIFSRQTGTTIPKLERF